MGLNGVEIGFFFFFQKMVGISENESMILKHQHQRQTHTSTIYQKDQSETRKQGIHIHKDIQ